MTKTIKPRSPNAPTHEVFAVSRREGSDKANWQKIGGCWPHDDGDGFSVKLEFLPLAGQELVIRKWKPKQEQADTQEGGAV